MGGLPRPPCPAGFRRRLLIRHIRWDVLYLPKIIDDDGSELAGRCFGDRHRIEVSLDQCRNEMALTLLHEGVHGYLRNESGWSDSSAADDFASGDRLEEGGVVWAVAGILWLLHANPWLRPLVLPVQ
jgi:hypothetical protein